LAYFSINASRQISWLARAVAAGFSVGVSGGGVIAFFFFLVFLGSLQVSDTGR
jgi:hypothetical protein